MELVGNCISIVENEGGIWMEFRCTNKDVFSGILVPPALRPIPEKLIRAHLHRRVGKDTDMPIRQWILNHFEELE